MRRLFPAFRPRVEALEDRQLLTAGMLDPSFFTVNWPILSLRIHHQCPRRGSRCSRFQPDLILLDLALPRSDGFLMVRQLRAVAATAAIAAVTALRQAADIARCLDHGFDYHLTRPVAPSELQALVLTIHSKSRSMPAAALSSG